LCAVSCLLAASLIDAELMIIPLEIPWLMALVGVVVHSLIDAPRTPGAIIVSPMSGALALGGGIGLIISIFLLHRGLLKRSFEQGEPLLEIDKKRIAER